MDFVKIVDTTVDFCKTQIDKAMDIWDSFDEDQKKLLIGCAVCVAAVIVVAGIAYGLGKAQGKRIALEEEDF
ncbi:MAG: hypothetical protein IJI01_06550 [Butyrivibrio sp.]|uniref:hypothetical protein n=1 Tax=Butyrivibrio sp. TaxID=28121 RepID=UPI0025BB3488|nr:hypothetical protein [Butyrivibrio sp.]MBQ6415217.1 hypothetical protein [Butyrivibrio sp.]MBQ6588320.1 hypothetical protein [Butyrivibrio sp.]